MAVKKIMDSYPECPFCKLKPQLYKVKFKRVYVKCQTEGCRSNGRKPKKDWFAMCDFYSSRGVGEKVEHLGWTHKPKNGTYSGLLGMTNYIPERGIKKKNKISKEDYKFRAVRAVFEFGGLSYKKIAEDCGINIDKIRYITSGLSRVKIIAKEEDLKLWHELIKGDD